MRFRFAPHLYLNYFEGNISALKMDAFDIQGCQGLNEDTQSVMYFDCFYDLSFTVPSLPFLRLNGVLCHFSFLDSPLEKRMCVQINFYFKTLMTNVGCVIVKII